MSTPDNSSANLTREDVHKSCKSLESVVNLLNGYCEAASTVVLLQKKLVRAIRDSASMRASPAVASNTLSTVATIFETISEVDGKFVKIMDRECDNVNGDVKKWFRKLAKEEKIHDEKLASASARVKQAGHTYEKKTKKNARDTAEEHARYIQLLSSLGHEMSQERVNHSNFVARKHASVTCSISSSLARIADAEWVRCCESVRKSSSQIGSLGEWRSFCDGGWTGKIPDDLPDAESSVTTNSSLAPLPVVEEGPKKDGCSETNKAGYTPANTLSTPPSPTAKSDLFQHEHSTVNNDIPALDHFPAPPVHFPLPHLRGVLKSSLEGSIGNPLSYGRRMLSPPSPTPAHPHSAATTPTEFEVATATQTPPLAVGVVAEKSAYFPVPSCSDRHQPASPADLSTVVLASIDTEFGAQHPQLLSASSSPESSSLPKGSPRGSGVVLAMRNRFSQNSVSSTPSREGAGSIPRPPLSVSTMASRYQPGSEHPPSNPERPRPVIPSESSLDGITGAIALSTNMNLKRTRKDAIPEKRDIEQEPREPELGPQRLIRPTSAQVEKPSIDNRSEGQNQPASSRATAGPLQNINTRRGLPVEAGSPRQCLTQDASCVSPHPAGSTSHPRENHRPGRPRGWLRRLSMPVLSSFDGSRKPDSPTNNDLSQAWRSSLALPESKTRHRKTSLGDFGSKSR